MSVSNMLICRFAENFTFVDCRGRYQPGRLAEVGESSPGASAILRKLFATCVRDNPASPGFLFSLLISLRLTVYNT